MGVFNKLKDFMGIEEVDEDDEDEEVEEEVKAPSIVPRTDPAEIKPAPRASAPAVRPEPAKPEVPKSNTYGANKYTTPIKLVVIEPAGFDESPKLVDSLKAKKPVIINLENLETDVARKIFDFLSGATYALNGNVQKVANNIFVFAPENVDISVPEENHGNFSDVVKSPWR